MNKHLLAITVAVGLTLTATAASKIRLMMGTGWNRASEDLRKALSSAKFKGLIAGKYAVEFVESKGSPNPPEDTTKTPTIYVLDEKGRCYFVFENVPYNYPVASLYRTINRVNETRQKIERGGTDTPEQCGRLLFLMERFVGGPQNVVKAGFYKDVFDKLVKLDPKDESGWVYHYTIGDGITTELDKEGWLQAGHPARLLDGNELVNRATHFLRDSKKAPGERYHKPGEADKWLEAEYRHNRKHLSKDQYQSLLMAKFALYREDPGRRDEMIKLLEKVADLTEDTFWGTAALGWLNDWHRAPLTLYQQPGREPKKDEDPAQRDWGWRKGDFAGRFSTTIKYGVRYEFSRAGEYTITFLPDGGAPLGITELTVFAKVKNEEGEFVDEPVAKYTPKKKDDPIVLTIPPEYAGKCTSMTVKGSTILDTTGRIIVHRRILKDRKIAGAK